MVTTNPFRLDQHALIRIITHPGAVVKLVENVSKLFRLYKSFAHAIALTVLLYLYLYLTSINLLTLPWGILITAWIAVIGITYLSNKFMSFMEYMRNHRTKYRCFEGVMLNYNSPECDHSLWEQLPTYEELGGYKRLSDKGEPLCWCGSKEIKDWGLENTADHKRVHVCVRCNYGIYRSTR